MTSSIASAATILATDWADDIVDSDHVRLFKTINWEASIGPLQSWTTSLRFYTHQLMSDSRPACIYWGPDKITIYNEAFIPLAGKAHPMLMGSRFIDIWPEIWDHIKPVFDGAESTRKAVDVVELPLMVERSGFMEETFFTGNFNPLRGDNGCVEGFYNALFEVTKQKVSNRRTEMMTLISLLPPECTSLSIGKHIMKCLETDALDVPLAMLYQVEAAQAFSSTSAPAQLILRGSSGIPEGHSLLVQQGHIDSNKGIFPLLRQTKFITPITMSVGNECDGIAWKGHGDPSKHLVTMPLVASGYLYGYLIIGTNPRRPLDEDHDRLVHELTTKTSAAMARAYEVDKLVMSEKSVRYMAEHLQVGLEHVDPDGKVLWANKCYYDMLGEQPRPEFFLTELPMLAHVLEEDQAKVLQNFGKVCTGTKVDSLEIRMKRMFHPPTGPPVPATILLSAFPFAEGGKITSIFASMTDVSRLKWAEAWQTRAAQEAQEAKRQQSEFTDALSHEVRNPLSAVIQLGDSISSSLDEYGEHGPTTVQACLEVLQQNIESARTIIACATHQKKVVDDVLTLAKLDFMSMKLAPVPVQPPDLVDGALKMVRADLAAADITLDIRPHASLQRLDIQWVLCDSLRIVQVLLNLISNSIKFTKHEKQRQIMLEYGGAKHRPNDSFPADILWVPRKEDSLDATLDEGWGQGEQLYLTFRVTDTGPGMTSEECKHLFNKFRQASPATSSRYGGTGLGLYISKVLVDKHGGSIGLSSIFGKGSTFAFFVKVRRVATPTTALATSMRDLRLKTVEKALVETAVVVSTLQKPAVEKQKELSRYHLLLVEDNLVNQKILYRQLTKAGCIVTTADHGLEALEALCSTNLWKGKADTGTPLDVILLDMQMPVMDGLTCCREIRSLEKSGQLTGHVEVIAVTANVRHEQIEHAIAAGVDGVMPKPFLVSDLLSTIRARLGR